MNRLKSSDHMVRSMSFVSIDKAEYLPGDNRRPMTRVVLYNTTA